MTYEREKRLEGHRTGESVAAKESYPAQLPPGRTTLTEALTPQPVTAERELDRYLERARQQLAVLYEANGAGDHHASGSAASEIRAALRIAGKLIEQVPAEKAERVPELEERLASARDEARSALELAFTPSPAAILEATAGTGRTLWDREVAAWRAARGRAGSAAEPESLTAARPESASASTTQSPSLVLGANSQPAPSKQPTLSKQSKATSPTSEQQLPGWMMIVTLLDASGKFITMRTEPLHGDAPSGAFFGCVNGNRIDWKQGASAGEIVVELSPRLGIQYDAKGHVTNPGVSIEQWLAIAGQGRARTVLIEIEPAKLFQHDKSSREAREGQKSDKRPPHPAGVGTVGATPSTAGGTSAVGSTTRSDDRGTTTGHVPDAPIKQPGRDAKYPGEEDVTGRPGGADKGPVHGKVTVHKEGSARGKSDGIKTTAGYHEDPAAPGCGTNNVTTDGSTPDGMVGGKGKQGDQGVPASSGLLPLISVPRQIAPAVALGMILLEADLANWADDVVKISFKLGKASADKGSALSKIVAGKFDRYVDREMEKISESLIREGQFIAKTAEEQAQILKQIREAVEIDAHTKLSAKLDQKIAEGERWAKEATEEQNQFTKDTVRDSLEYAEAARRAKDALPRRGASVQTQPSATRSTHAPVADPKAAATSGGRPTSTVGKEAAERLAGFTATERAILTEAKQLISGKEMTKIRAAFTAGKPVTVRIGGRIIQYEPGLPASGMTMFGENGFVIGREAFRSEAELSKTVLHELYRLTTSVAKTTGTSAGAAAAETKAAADFAERAYAILRSL